jgi:hypothetical protein
MKYIYFSLVIFVWSCQGIPKEGDDFFKQGAYEEAIVAYSDYLSGHGPTIAVLYNRGTIQKCLDGFSKNT